jgi:FKBP-type peptidyl-prolyl cis-trans isomerase SlyD
MASRKDESIAAGKVVTLAYSLRDEEGDVLDSSEDDGPLVYLHGQDNIVPGLEKALTGKTVGEKLRVVVPPEEGYGEWDEEGVQVLARGTFPPEVELEVGLQLVMEDEDGDPMPFWIAEIAGDDVTIDFNHPLAGAQLDFDVEVLAIRDATEAELSHGHPHEDGDDHDD